MLEPDYFNDKCDKILDIYRTLENYILNDIAQRILKSGEISATADRMTWKLTQMGEHRSTILAKLSKLTKLSRQELRELLQNAVLTSWKDDLSTFNKLGIQVSEPLKNKKVISIMDAEYAKSLGELENLTGTTLNRSSCDLIRMLDEAEIRVAAGIQSYSAAVCDILDNYAAAGIKVSYPSGTERSLESAVRMAVVTSMNQTSAQITNQYIQEGGVEYVLVSAHMGARIQGKGQPYLAGHENWQGRVYKIRGSEEGAPNLAEKTGYDITPDGKGVVLNPLGLHGYNCRHSHKPWDIRLRNPYIDKDGRMIIDTEESRETYRLQQKQRAMERSIRKTKRELLIKQQELKQVAETDIREMLQPQYDRLAFKLREQNKAYNDFCEENGLQRQQDRLKTAGFKAGSASMANGRATVHEKNVPKRDAYKTIRLSASHSIEKGNCNKPRLIGEIDEKKRKDAIEYFGNEIRNSEIEKLVAIDKNGKVYYNERIGDFVSLEGINLEGCMILHNHPVSNGILSFGEDDFLLIRDTNDVEWYLVNEKYNYYARKKPGIELVSYNTYYLKGLNSSLHEKEDIQHLAFEELKKDGYITYERREVKK